MKLKRLTNPNPPLYRHLQKRLHENGGVLPLNSEEVLAYWITVLQRTAAEFEFGTNSDPIEEAPKLMVVGRGKHLRKLDCLKDDPRKIMDESRPPIELYEQ
jgi:hypothetical protein